MEPCRLQTPKLLNGTWRLVYTANSELLPLLGLARLPLVTVEEITQTIDGNTMSVENKVWLAEGAGSRSLR